MLGTSHSAYYALWHHGEEASPGLIKLVETADPTLLEREIIAKVIIISLSCRVLSGTKKKNSTSP
jgi:hypothetical protein